MNLYLTRVTISKLEAAKLRLSDLYTWHQTLWHAFPDSDGQPRDFLTRIDPHGAAFRVLILSSRPPQPQPWGIWETKRIPTEFFQHVRYRFALRANPTQMRVKRDENGQRRKNGYRSGIYDPVQLREWIERKLKQAGCQVEQVAFDPPIQEWFYRKECRAAHLRVDFRGILRVIDREAFLEAVRCGIGRARGFGFGMLLLDPLPTISQQEQTQSAVS